MIPEFNNPHAFWLLLLIPVYLICLRRHRRTCAVRYPSVHNLKRLPRSFRQRCRFCLPMMRIVSLVLLIVVLARPMRAVEVQKLPSEGIGIGILIDRSASMGDPNGKLMFNGKLEFRFDIATTVLKQFIEGDGAEMKGRPNDLIGLVSFATYPRTDFPFSLDRTSLLNVVDNLEAEKFFLDELGRPTNDQNKAARVQDRRGRVRLQHNPMQMTSLKSAIEYTTNKMVLLEEDLQRPTEDLRKYDLKSKVMILLTDGEPTVADNRGARDFPDEETIKTLIDEGIKVYFIQVLARERYRELADGTIQVTKPRGLGLFGSLSINQDQALVNQAIEEARKLARRTGGEHFLAASGDEIRTIYERIDELERSDVGARAVFTHEERFRPYLLMAMALIMGEVALALTWLRRAP
jgi:Ca-activated chloride channel family protein